jgi:hypothetical protein
MREEEKRRAEKRKEESEFSPPNTGKFTSVACWTHAVYLG